tara:strand:- start:5254 stop:6093 length:840 start_codon:yes stop_codon:yes gene_type:complete
MSARLHAVLHVGQKLPTPTGARDNTPQPKSINAGNAPRAAQLGQRATPLDKPKAPARATTAPTLLDTSDDTKWIEKLVNDYQAQRMMQLKTLEAARKAADACAETEDKAEKKFEGTVRGQAFDAITGLAEKLKAKTVAFNELQAKLEGNITANGNATAALEAEKAERAAEVSRLTEELNEGNEKAAAEMASVKANGEKLLATVKLEFAESDKKHMEQIAKLTKEKENLNTLVAKCGDEEKEKIKKMQQETIDARKKYATLNDDVCKMLQKFKLYPGGDQ